tara:strand:+ start:391 stop:603 length:213 start_codon:yes stop_codon:yes gene_type:complete
MSADALIECPECKKDSLRRIISGGTGLIFKGSGYYLTDYKEKVSTKTDKKENNPKKKEKNNKQNKKVVKK